jgi:2-polyprenyl-6-methoxyphenol hydroxylase-like FAD-dependent oxidoreductase
MSSRPLEVLIVGGGIGGLCLAQGLHKAGVSATVYERDTSPISRTQGFRVHISPGGSRALHDCLTPDMFALFCATCGEFGQGFYMVTEHLSELMAITPPVDPHPEDSVESHRSVSRITLRRVLLAGIEPRVHFGKRFASFASLPDGRVEVHFEDGTSAQGDILIGADGVNSAIRKQYLPDASPVDTGVVAVGGKIPLTPSIMALMPIQLLAGPMIVMARQPVSLFMAAWKRQPEQQQRLNAMLPDSASDLADEGEEDYLVLGFGARRGFFGLDSDLDQATGADLHRTLRRIALGWHPNLRKLIEMLDPAGLGVQRIRTSEPPPPWPTTNVTLLGDAIHSMTPYRGIGANVALKDAALLCSELAAVSRGEKDLLPAIHQYETAMREYGFKAVKDSREMMDRAVSDRGFAFGMTKMTMKAINALGPVKQRIMARAADV